MKRARMRSPCACCGALAYPGEYHPFAFCVLVKVLGVESARANFDAVIEHVRAKAAAEITPKRRARAKARAG